jgi:hypothetical protein
MNEAICHHRLSVIARLNRATQYAVPSRFNHGRLRLLDAPLSQGMTADKEETPHERAA